MHTLIKFTAGLLIGLMVQQSAFAGPAADAFARKDYNEAYRQWSKTPDSLEAKFGIGRILFEGLGGPKDTDKGLASIRDAASAGYRPAMEYLANFYQKEGAYKSAITYLRRLQESSKSRQRQEDIVRMLGTLTTKPNSKNKEFCEELKTLAELGGSADKTTTRECALNGLPSAMTKAQAEAELKRTLATTPSFNALERLAPAALNPQSSGFDPESVFNALLKVDPSLSSSNTKSLADLGAVSREVCISLPASTLKQKLNQLSYCALVAIKGDIQLAVTSARAFAEGGLGRKSPELALTFAKLAGSPPELNGLQLQMLRETPPANSKWNEHLDFLVANAQTLNASELEAALQFQIEAASIPVQGYGRDKYAMLLNVAVGREKIELEQLEQLLNARDRLPAPTVFGALGGEPKDLDGNYELLKKRFSGIPGVQHKLKKARASGDIKSLLTLINELMTLNPTMSQEERIKLIDDTLELINLRGSALEATSANALAKLFLSVSFGETNEGATKGNQTALVVMRKLEQSQSNDVRKTPEASDELSQNIQKIKSYLLDRPAIVIQQAPIEKYPTPSREVTPKIKLDAQLSDLEEKKLLCDKTRAPDICRDAGRLLTIKFLNERYQLKALDALTEAVSYLNKAVWGGDLLAHRYMVDALEGKQGATEAEKNQSAESLEYLLARGDIGGELRLHLKTINTNILERTLSGLGSIFTRENKFAAACSKVKSLVDGNRLDEYDRDLAIAGLNSLTCKPPTAQ
jgi:hypothetical protein